MFAELLSVLSDWRVWTFTASSRTRARFTRTKLGSFWVGFSALFTIAVLTFFYSRILGQTNNPSYTLYVATGLGVWIPLSAGIIESIQAVDRASNKLLGQVISPLFFIFEEWFFHLQQTLIIWSFLIVSAFLFGLFGPVATFLMHSLFPIVVYSLFLFFWVFLASLFGVFQKDVAQIVPVVMNLVFLTTPILYERLELTGLSRIILVYMNPFYWLLHAFREAFAGNSPGFLSCLIWFVSLLTGLVSLYLFYKFTRKSLFFSLRPQ